MNDALNLSDMTNDLRAHLEVCRSIWNVVERESQVLRQPTTDFTSANQEKKNLLPALQHSLNRIRQHRIDWVKRPLREREREGQVPTLLREIQDLIMKIIIVDRENEQALLRKGLVPARYLPHPNRQRPHYVADLYQQQGQACHAPVGQ